MAVKQELLFLALTDISDDLVMMAQEKRFPNPWRRWGKLAASVGLILCLGTLALPYFPMGCGSSTAETESVTTTTEEWKEFAMESVAEESAAEESPEQKEETDEGMEVVSFRLAGRRYEVQPGIVEQPADLGEKLGLAEDSDGRDLNGCPVYASGAEELVYIETPEGYFCAVWMEEN